MGNLPISANKTDTFKLSANGENRDQLAPTIYWTMTEQIEDAISKLEMSERLHMTQESLIKETAEKQAQKNNAPKYSEQDQKLL